jgi:HK97 gp10 family phage protein
VAGYLRWRGDEVVRNVESAARKAVEETNKAKVNAAQGRAAVRSGEMRAGIRNIGIEVSGSLIRGTWGGTARHSIFVELGTVHMRAQPFLRPTDDAENQKLAGRIASELR